MDEEGGLEAAGRDRLLAYDRARDYYLLTVSLAYIKKE